MNKLLRTLIVTTHITTGVGLTLFATSLIFQVKDWIMVALTLVFFAIGAMIIFSGIQIAHGGSIKEILGELFRTMGR